MRYSVTDRPLCLSAGLVRRRPSELLLDSEALTNDSGSYERVYMGATYRYNPEDATAFRMLPITDDDYLVQEITARCVAEPAGS